MATSLKRTLEKLDDLPDALKALYTEKDGHFVLALEGDDDDDDTSRGKGSNGNGSIDEAEMNRRIREATRKLGKEASDARKAAAAFQDLGLSPEQIREIVEDHEKRKTNDLESKGQWETLRAQMVAKQDEEKKALQKKIDDAQKRAEALEGEIRELMLSNSISTAIAENGGRPNLLGPALRQFASVEVGDDGQRSIKIVGSDRQPKFTKEGKPMSIAEFVAEMRASDEWASAFNGTGATGGGSRSSGSGGGAPPVTTKAQFKNDTERYAFHEKYGKAAYDALPDK